MATVYINPMSFRPRIQVSKNFVVRMIDLYIDLEVTNRFARTNVPKRPSKTEFNNWYKDQVLLFGIDGESQGLRDKISAQAEDCFIEWYGMPV